MKLNLTTEKKNEIIDVMKVAEACSFRNPFAVYTVTYDSNGDIDYECKLHGDNSWTPTDKQEYWILDVISFDSQCFDILWDWYWQDTRDFEDSFKEAFDIDPEPFKYCINNELGFETCRANDLDCDDFDDWIENQYEAAIDCWRDCNKASYEERLEDWIFELSD